MTPSDVVIQLLQNKSKNPGKPKGEAFAPANIALVKYWGKRNAELNLPDNHSLSLSLGNLGATTTITPLDHTATQDSVILNQQPQPSHSTFHQRIENYLNYFRSHFSNPNQYFSITTHSTVPVAAGLASSASGFAALILALDDLYQWNFSKQTLSILARLGSGSACRSLWNGFVKWQRGVQEDGSDSHGIPLDLTWPELKIGLLLVSDKPKPIGSREAMALSRNTSPLYKTFHERVTEDIHTLEEAIAQQDFHLLGKTAQNNALAMHGTMDTANPAFSYDTEATTVLKLKLLDAQRNGLPIYFTQDAGPNLKGLFLEKNIEEIRSHFTELMIL